MASPIDPRRVHIRKELPHRDGRVIYWMGRDMRRDDNWALLFAQSLAVKYRMPFAVVFVLQPSFPGATIRAYDFLLRGLQEVERSLAEKEIPFVLLTGVPEKEIPSFVRSHDVTKVVTDFNPLRFVEAYKQKVTDAIDASFFEVDAHNIIPVRHTSPKQEFGAYTLRPKIHRLLPEFLTDFPSVRKHTIPWPEAVTPVDWEKARRSLKCDRTVLPVEWIVPGEDAAERHLEHFLEQRFSRYDAERNDPTMNGQSGLSPYFHFGHLAPQRAALEVMQKSGRDIREIVQKDKNGAANERGNDAALLEELIVRRELSDNFTHYNPHYDAFEGFPEWAKLTINEHRKDKREFLYTLDEFDNGKTHEPLWNAAQRQMVKTGKMHGYLRMYWAKKILEWTAGPEEAMEVALSLNDRYELDGRDPNGFAGVAWSIGGVHDRAWFERPVFGKIRYMNANGCRSKFDVDAFIAAMNALE